MDVSRLGFIRGALASFGFGRLFAAPPGWRPSKAANLVFGVVSDTHLRTRHGSSGKPGRNWPDKYFAAALKYFREQNVDAVVHCGDFAHRGQVEEMRFHANVWNKTFPKNLAPDGHKVEKLFVTGNHDTDGVRYGDFVKNNYPDPDVRAKHVLQTDMAANWERAWGEKYEPVWHKEVKGYHFFGRNYTVPLNEVVASMKKHAAELSKSKAAGRPFFYMQHTRPLWDARKVLRHLCRGCSPLAFFGHNHWSASNWNVISLYRGGVPCIQVPSCEPRGCGGLVGDRWISKGAFARTDAVGRGRQGYVVRVYDDMLVISRREFALGGSLGQDWIMPLGKRARHPFSREELKKAIGEPQFRAGAKLVVAERSDASGIDIKIPLADGNPKSRVYAYEVEIAGETGKLCKAVYAAGCNLGMGREPDGGVTTLQIMKSEIPKGKMRTVSVAPLTSLGTKGRALISEPLRAGRLQNFVQVSMA